MAELRRLRYTNNQLQNNILRLTLENEELKRQVSFASNSLPTYIQDWWNCIPSLVPAGGENEAETGQTSANEVVHQQDFNHPQLGFYRCCCGAFYRSQTGLQSHIRHLTFTCKFNCPVCQKQNATLYQRNVHMATIHKILPDPGEGKFGCGFCGGIFHTRGELISHQRVEPSGDEASPSHAQQDQRPGSYHQVNGSSSLQQTSDYLDVPSHESDDVSTEYCGEDFDDDISDDIIYLGEFSASQQQQSPRPNMQNMLPILSNETTPSIIPERIAVDSIAHRVKRRRSTP